MVPLRMSLASPDTDSDDTGVIDASDGAKGVT